MSCFVQIATPPSHLPPNPNHQQSPNSRNTISLIQKCTHSDQIAPIHASIIKNGQHHDQFIIFELLRFCSKSNAIDYALKIFEKTQQPNVYVYTAIIDGLVSNGSFFHGIRLYVQMLENFIFPDNFVINSGLKACGLEPELRMGREIHAHGLKLGLYSNRQVKLKVMELYGKCGEFDDMNKVFDEMPDKDTVCWTAMINGLVKNGEMNKALDYFRQMQREKNVRANEFTIVCILSACAQLGALELGKWVHSYVDKYNIKINHFVGSALINMYSKCGSIEEAERVFKRLIEKDVSTYNSMINGFAMNGKSKEAVEIFRKMINNGENPTDISFVAVLNACSHGGLVDIGFEIFQSMRKTMPKLEHYGCMVDLLGRAGKVDEAYKFIQDMKVEPDHIIWGSLLSACMAHKKYELGERVVRILSDRYYGCLDTGTYVLISNFYSSWGKWEQALLVRKKLNEIGVQKEPGCSLIEVNNEVHEFLLGDIRHPRKKAIYEKLRELEGKLRLEGYCPKVDIVSQDIKDEEKEMALGIHSERLAICYGLISTEPCRTLRVVKNLRVCDDCHTMIKLVSKITRRRIIMRDRNRFHHFENGGCSCGDYW
ncbi:putative pentatricopeptide repeat-containing protein at5g59200 chloroplastic [Phtheirospermum japonicum]|uniref:Putative pentatricopeptide repeat-containing protein at5g59200 chloroplastic n=1 Tax=Phtheirospermum japonicum TaxID=374723 RepID=A0A830CS67_9LAMI|nr:putative pentatricopeptide repeat-containing protein at5g59200 chloroplastic [Phtheirospermum japonicum]